MRKSFILILLVMASVTSIFIPLARKIPRCMIVYSVGESETVKLELNFPPIPNQLSYETYEVSWKNTQSNEVRSESIRQGKFKRELALTTNIIYEVCLSVVSERDFGQVQVEYTATNIFSLNHAEVQVPEKLLKTKDITNTFLNANEIERLMDAFTVMQGDRNELHDKIFEKTDAISTRMVQISMFELVIIVLAGVYQFFAIRRYLQDKHYI